MASARASTGADNTYIILSVYYSIFSAFLDDLDELFGTELVIGSFDENPQSHFFDTPTNLELLDVVWKDNHRRLMANALHDGPMTAVTENHFGLF